MCERIDCVPFYPRWLTTRTLYFSVRFLDNFSAGMWIFLSLVILNIQRTAYDAQVHVERPQWNIFSRQATPSYLCIGSLAFNHSVDTIPTLPIPSWTS